MIESKNQKQRGATMVEYAVLVAFLVTIVIASARVLGYLTTFSFVDLQLELTSPPQGGGGGEGEGGGGGEGEGG